MLSVNAKSLSGQSGVHGRADPAYLAYVVFSKLVVDLTFAALGTLMRDSICGILKLCRPPQMVWGDASLCTISAGVGSFSVCRRLTVDAHAYKARYDQRLAVYCDLGVPMLRSPVWPDQAIITRVRNSALKKLAGGTFRRTASKRIAVSAQARVVRRA